MKESGLTRRFVAPEAAAYDEGFKDSEGHWISVHSLLNSMAYNEYGPAGEEMRAIFTAT
jgi:hypothetical protein